MAKAKSVKKPGKIKPMRGAKKVIKKAPAKGKMPMGKKDEESGEMC